MPLTERLWCGFFWATVQQCYGWFLDMDGITLPLYNYYKNKIRSFCKYDKELMSEADDLFDQFINQIYESNHTIRKFVLFDQDREKKRLKKSSKHFVFIFDVYNDGSSRFRIQYAQSCHVDYNKDFLISKFRKPEGYVYFLSSDHGYKIGMTNSIDRRISEFNIQLPFEFTLDSYIKSDNYESIEKELHKMMEPVRLNGEWFDLSVHDFEIIDKYCESINVKRANHG